MKVVFTDRSRARLHEIQADIAPHHARAAVRVVDRIIYAAEMLQDYPKLGAPWQGGQTRALSVPSLPYRIHYRIKGDVVQVFAIAHTSQKPQRFFWPVTLRLSVLSREFCRRVACGERRQPPRRRSPDYCR